MNETRPVQAMRAVLAGLLQDVVQAENRLDNNTAARLLAANEQLVISALRAQAETETAAGALDEASRTAGHDALTGLPNRSLLLDRLAQAIAHAGRQGTQVALLFVDLDNFKQVNDSFGHAVGDQVLERVAQCLSASVRETDTVSRHGGDEFLILLATVASAADAAHVARKIVGALAAIERIGEHALRPTASIGISLYPRDGESARPLIDRADTAMYRAKGDALGGFVFHCEPITDARAASPLPPESMKQRLARCERALARHERRHARLLEANEQLVLAALGARELQASAEQAQRRQTEFLAVVAEELSNPLAPIRIATTMLGQLGTDEPLLPRAQAIIERQVEQMSRMVNYVLDPGRVDGGKLSIQFQRVDMAGILDDAVCLSRRETDRRMQTLEVDVPAGPLEVLGDPARLAQVFGNLLTNATMYAQETGTLGLSATVAGAQLVVTVSDGGVGIAADALSTIFDPFVQDEHAIGFSGGGLGIGLTVVREIVAAHGGRVAATSAGLGQGSQFVVTLPLAPR